MNKNTEKSKILRAKRAALGQKEIRGLWATDAEEIIIKPMVRKKLKKLRENKP